MSTCENFVNISNKKHSIEGLTPYTSGEEKCAPNHFWGAGVRSSFLIHYVISGKGVFYCGTKKYSLNKGQIFVIFPDTIVKYQADEDSPWHYSWVNFSGDEGKELLKNLSLSIHNPVMTVNNGAKLLDILRQMPREYSSNTTQNLRFKSLLYEFMSCLYDCNRESVDTDNKYFSDATRYISAYYYENLTVSSLAEFLGISRKYLFAIFKKAVNKSPQDYIIEYRILKARDFLKNKNLNIKSVAYSVGYKDPLTFSKIFKSKIGMSPSEYQKTL